MFMILRGQNHRRKQGGSAPPPDPPSTLNGVLLYYNNRTEHVSGNSGVTINGSVTYDVAIAEGQGFQITSNAAANGVDSTVGLPDGLGDVTIMVRVNITAMNSNGALLSAPAVQNAWSGAFTYLSLRRSSTTSSAQLTWSNLSNLIVTVTSTASFLETGVWRSYVAVRQGTAIRFYRNGVLHSSHSDANGQGSPSNRPNVALGVRHSQSGGNSANTSISGTYALHAVWNRALTDDEILSMHNDPLQLIAWL